MVKFIFTDNTEMKFHGTDCKHQPNYGRFLVTQPDSGYAVIIPERNVKICGVWDKEKNEFK